MPMQLAETIQACVRYPVTGSSKSYDIASLSRLRTLFAIGLTSRPAYTVSIHFSLEAGVASNRGVFA